MKEKNSRRYDNKNPKEYNIESLYTGINECHTGHRGVTVAKLMHAVVVYKDIIHGDGRWHWSDHKVQAGFSAGPVAGRTQDASQTGITEATQDRIMPDAPTPAPGVDHTTTTVE